jgi:hypothetical protein
MKTVRIVRPDDETVEVWVGDELIVEANHDEHGWVGMDVAAEAATGVARALGAEVTR